MLYIGPSDITTVVLLLSIAFAVKELSQKEEVTCHATVHSAQRQTIDILVSQFLL